MVSKGDRLPDVVVARATPDGPEAVGTGELMGKGKSVLFAVPGAFTPTCSARHLPGFVERMGDFAQRGVDRVVCTSVNDAFVMQAWAEEAGAGDVVMLADGNGEFARAMGLAQDSSAFGMGERSRRYAAVVEDGVITHVAVEEGGSFGVSSADAVLAHL